MKYILLLLIVVSFISCSDSGNHYDDPWNPPTADNLDNEGKPVKDSVKNVHAQKL